jgi:hypothetical protein
MDRSHSMKVQTILFQHSPRRKVGCLRVSDDGCVWIALPDVGDQSGDRNCPDSLAATCRITDRVIDTDVIGAGAHPGGVLGIITTPIPLAPSDRPVILDDKQSFGRLGTGDASTQFLDLLQEGRTHQVPLGHLGQAQPGGYQVDVGRLHPTKHYLGMWGGPLA